jgi:Na+/H+ antiporter NhaD/arsenite permease-like protein
MHADTAPSLILGLDPLWFATGVFAVTYILVMTERINRAIVAMLAAGVMVLAGVLTQKQAVSGVDFNTLGLLTGMMVIVAITRKSGVFQFLAVWSAKKVNADPWGILVMLALVTAVLSAFLDNVTTVLLVAPVTLLITETLRVSPYPYLFAQIFAANIGGTATLIGDPPNIMIGSAVGYTFNDFVIHLAPIVVVIMAATLVPIYLIWGRSLHAHADDRRRVMEYDEHEAITDRRVLVQSLSVLALVIAGFIAAHNLHQEPSTIALFGAAVLLLLDNYPRNAEEQTHAVHSALTEVEWVTLFFFLGLFIVVHGLEVTGALTLLAEHLLSLTGGDMGVTAMVILWGSAVASAVVDNIPFVASTIPLIKAMAPTFGGADNLMPLWWSLALGACLGGNGSLVGASANLIVAGFAERAGHRIKFVPFMLIAFPLMLLSILIASGYVWLRYL